MCIVSHLLYIVNTNPAKAMLDGVKRGIPLKSFIEQYAAV